jgi:hypothetical protein
MIHKKGGERSAGYGLKEKKRGVCRYFNPPQASLNVNTCFAWAGGTFFQLCCCFSFLFWREIGFGFTYYLCTYRRTRGNIIWKRQKFSCLYPKYTNLVVCSIPTSSFISIFFGAPASHCPFSSWVLRGSPTGWPWPCNTKHKPSQISVTLLVKDEACLQPRWHQPCPRCSAD